MSEKFITGMINEDNITLTENSMLAVKSTLDDVLDFFGTSGALRKRTDLEITQKFSKAFNQDAELALKALFYTRDIRGGLGERRTFRVILNFLGDVHPEVLKPLLYLIPEYGRWDDVFSLFGTALETDALNLVGAQMDLDLKYLRESEHGTISLLGKWLPSVGPNAAKIRNHFNISPRSYRHILSALRKKLDIVERKMSAKEWDKITYQFVPSNAMLKYRKAFSRNDTERFVEYLESVKKGVKEIKATTLYPYDLIGKYRKTWNFDEVVEAQWKALPNYIEGEHNILIMADTSGSMTWDGGRPIDTSVGLALYFAERNSGPYHNKFMTFSSSPQFVDVKGKTLFEQYKNAVNAEWGGSTNIMAAMRMILKVAVANKLTSKDLPKALVIVSDMEFDHCASVDTTMFAAVTKEFNNAGFELPKIVFWNVNSRNDVFHATANDSGVYLVSGQSVSAFKGLVTHLSGSAVDYMLKVLNDPRYEKIVLERA